ncbi:hypothetical protein A2U01_0102338 [Trifolium medium]|uniref:Uncharacterized protein n=1 Tax=Trifolium medium TaxID=97028 RepID=A0A392UYH2_9FABA|nr:hypothetical protein [Trifolium medium]
MKLLCVLNVMLKFMLLISLLASIKGFFFNVYLTSFPNVIYAKYA